MAWLSDWWLSIFAASATIRKLRSEIEKLKLSVELKEQEQASIERQLTAAIDTVQAFGLHNRVIGMEAKILEADLIARTRPQQ